MLSRNDRGFTLIELMVVVVVLTILVGLVLLGVQPFQTASSSAACRSEIDSLKTADVAYQAKHGTSAPNEDALIAEGFIEDPPKYVTIAGGTTDPASDAGCNTISGSASATTTTTEATTTTTVATTTTTVATTTTTTLPSVGVTAIAGLAAPVGASANWTTTLTVTVTSNGLPVSGATVTGTWDNGRSPSSCGSVTNALGSCTIGTTHNSGTSARWSVSSVSKSGYTAGANGDPDITCSNVTLLCL